MLGVFGSLVAASTETFARPLVPKSVTPDWLLYLLAFLIGSIAGFIGEFVWLIMLFYGGIGLVAIAAALGDVFSIEVGRPALLEGGLALLALPVLAALDAINAWRREPGVFYVCLGAVVGSIAVFVRVSTAS
jgi:hypothetical protein